MMNYILKLETEHGQLFFGSVVNDDPAKAEKRLNALLTNDADFAEIEIHDKELLGFPIL